MFFKKKQDDQEGLLDLADIEVTQPPVGWTPEEEEGDN